MLRRVILVLIPLLAVACTGTSAETTIRVTETVATTTTSTEAKDAVTLVVEELMATTEEIRGLSFLSMPDVVFLAEDEFEDRVRAVIDEEFDPDELARDELLLELLGLIDPERDLRRLYADLYAEQVAGYYDGDSKELVVPVRAGLPSPLERLTLIHELTHALTDQYFEFSDEMTSLEENQRYEEAIALSALVEGDATLTESLYLRSLPIEDQQTVLEAVAEIDSSALRNTPRFIQELLLFPYTAGHDFVEHVWDSAGFAAVDALYGSPPTTTENIYHPADFQLGEPQVPVTPGVIVPEGYTIAEQSVWGQAGLRAMFGQALDDAVATAAAVGWGGDSYRLLWDGADEIVFELRYVADSSIDLREMYATLVDFVSVQLTAELDESDESYVVFDGDDFAYISNDGTMILFVASSDPAIGRRWLEDR